jgi:hypothetical protein
MAIIKVATYDNNNFQEKIFLYSDKWIAAQGFRSDVEKYVLLDKADGNVTLLTVSKRTPSAEVRASYNCIFHVWSLDPLTAKSVLDEFIEKTGFEAKPAPNVLEAIFNKLDFILNAYYRKTGTVKLN